jgi:16S rRNA processing protein RimM
LPRASEPQGDDGVVLGVVVAAHGLKGEVKVKSFATNLDAFDAYGPLHMEDGRIVEVEAVRAGGSDLAILRFKGVADRSAAEALRGLSLSVPRSALPDPEEDEFYYTDLIGARAEDEAGKVLGTVRAVQNYGAGDMIEILDAEGALQLFPFTREVVPVVDVAAKRLVIRPPQEIE